MIKTNRIIFVILSIVSAELFAQPERYTNGAENGYAWLAMENPLLIYDNSKYNYLSDVLERINLLLVK